MSESTLSVSCAAPCSERGAGAAEAADPRLAPAVAQFEALFHKHYAPLCDYVYGYVRSRAVAQELVQDLFLRLWERAGTPADTLAAAYLYTAARNRAVGYLRHERVASAWAQQPACAASTVGRVRDADEPLHEHELREALERAVAELPERCRLVFILSRYHNLSNGDIARVLSISPNTVEQQMWRALKALRIKLLPYLE